MIRLFDRDETDFSHNETVLTDVISAEPDVIANGMYELVLEYPRNEFAKQLTEGKIIKAPTPNGDQLFRIYKPIKNLTTYTIYARHIFYDLLTNFLEDVRPEKTNGQGALNAILNQAEIDQGFSGISDISDTGTAYYVRKSPVEALLGASNSFVNVWGGELVRDNYTIKILSQAGQDRGYEVTIGKNLQGIEVTTDESNVFTRIYPTVVIDDQVVTTLPEKYVDSPLIGRYEYPRIVEERIDLTDDEKELPIEEIYTLMRNHCDYLFEEGIDKPEVNFKIDFIELSQTEQYKHLKILEQLDLYDMVSVYVPELDVDVTAKVIRIKYDSLRKRYINMELGHFKADGGTQAKNTINRTDKKIDEASSYLQQAFDEAQEKITGNLGGHVITRLNAEGKPYELLVMDTEDIQTAKNVIRLNQQGIGFSENGYNGPFGVAITIDGKLNAEIIDVLNMTMGSITGGSIELTDGFKITNNGHEVLSIDSSGKVVFDVAGIPTQDELDAAIDGIELGGRNYLANSSFESGNTGWTTQSGTVLYEDGVAKTTGTPAEIYKTGILAGFDVVTVSVWVKGTGRFQARAGGGSRAGYTDFSHSDFKQVSSTFSDMGNTNLILMLDGENLEVEKIKLEKGNIASDYQEAPEDTEEKINKKADTEVVDELDEKVSDTGSLIENNSTEILSMYERMQNYRELLEQNEIDSETALQEIENLLAREVAIQENLGEFAREMNFINTQIRYSEEGIYIQNVNKETGQSGNKSIRISNDSIDFMDGNTRMGYMSGQTLYVTHAHFDTVQFGEHKAETINGRTGFIWIKP